MPAPDALNLPEKVLMFGTGVLLRGLPSHFIETANRQRVFNGRIVMVKSTDAGDTSPFARQEGLFTHLVQGYRDGVRVDDVFVNAAISRVLVARSEWDAVRAVARNPDLSVVISNTTESGIIFDPHDRIDAAPPSSFPGKLLALLLERYRHFNGAPEKGWVILPTELIPDNGRKLMEILVALAEANGLDAGFVTWLLQSNPCCNTLVDRIVPGRPGPERQTELQARFGYHDELVIMSEPYALWAIETRHPKVPAALSFASVNPAMCLRPDIAVPRELKLRLLNGTHTFSCGVAVLAGFATVDAAMDDPLLGGFVRELMEADIIPALEHTDITRPEALAYAAAVIDRFRNPHIGHRWLSITVNYSRKMEMRNLPLIRKARLSAGRLPERMALALAAYLRFMRVVPTGDGRYLGSTDGHDYEVQDEFSAFYADIWRDPTPRRVVELAFGRTDLWGADPAQDPGFIDAVTDQLTLILDKGVREALARVSNL